jgi:hypothetical protein
MAGWLERKSQLTITGDKFYKLRFETPDEGGKLGLAIEDGLMRIYEHQKSTNIFGIPKLVLKDASVPDYAGGMLGMGASEISPEKPVIHLPPNGSGKVFTTPPDPNDPSKKTVLIQLTVEEAAIILHEVNHGTHRCVNNGKYKQPISRYTIGEVDQDLRMGIMSKSLQTKLDFMKGSEIKFANEVETYWLSCCDAAKYQMSEEAITQIKKVNNQNLIAAKYAYLANPKQAQFVQDTIDEKNMTPEKKEKADKAWANMFDPEKIDVTQPTVANPNALDELDEQQP